MQNEPSSLQRKDDFAGCMSAGGAKLAEADSINEPGTPVRDEAFSPATLKGVRLGTLNSDPPKSDNYALLYEEANMMLKNLHFARLQRHAQQAVPR